MRVVGFVLAVLIGGHLITATTSQPGNTDSVIDRTVRAWQKSTSVVVPAGTSARIGSILHPESQWRLVFRKGQSGQPAPDEFVTEVLTRHYLYALSRGATTPINVGEISQQGFERVIAASGVTNDRPFGELLVQSDPSRAPVRVIANNRVKTGDTETTFLLSPGSYTVEVQPEKKKSCTQVVVVEAYKRHSILCV